MVDIEGGVVRLAVAVRRASRSSSSATRAQDAVADALKTMCGIDPQVEIDVGELA